MKITSENKIKTNSATGKYAFPVAESLLFCFYSFPPTFLLTAA